MEEQSDKIWTRQFIALSCINFLLTLIFFLLIIVIGGYAAEEFDATTSEAGLVASIFIVGALLGRLSFGSFIRKFNLRKMLFIGLLLFFISTGLYFVAFNLPLLLANRLFHGFALGIASTAVGTYVAKSLPAGRKGEGIGYFSLSSIISTAIGPFLGMVLIQHFDFTVIFTLNFIWAIICFALFYSSKWAVEPVSATGSLFSLSNYIEKRAIPISVIALIIGFAYSGILSFLSFYVEERSLLEAGSYFFIVYAIVVLFTRPFTGKLLDRRGPNIVMYPCMLLFALGMYVFSVASTGFLLLFAAMLIGIGYGNFNSVAQAMAIKTIPPERMALATSTYFIMFDFGLGFGPYVLGFFVGEGGYAPIYSVMVLVIVFAIACYYILVGRKEQKLV